MVQTTAVLRERKSTRLIIIMKVRQFEIRRDHMVRITAVLHERKNTRLKTQKRK